MFRSIGLYVAAGMLEFSLINVTWTQHGDTEKKDSIVPDYICKSESK